MARRGRIIYGFGFEEINIGHVDENGLYDGRFTTFALSGFVRGQGDADGALDRLWQQKRAEIKQ